MQRLLENMKKTTQTQTPRKVVVTSPEEATRYLREYMRTAEFSNNSTHYTIGTSKARWSSVAQMRNWYLTNRSIDLDSGWFGRSLNKASSTGFAVSINKVPDGKRNILVYRNAKA